MADRPTLTAADAARLTDGTLAGDPRRVITGVAPLAVAGPEELAWLGSAKYAARAAESRAGVILVAAGVNLAAEHTTITVPDPDRALCVILAALQPPGELLAPGIHPTATVSKSAVVTGACIGPHAYVSHGAVVGPGTQLHHGAFVGAHARVGPDCVLWQHVVVRDYVTVGARVIIHPNSTIGADGFGYLQRDGRNLKIPQIGTVVIEDDVEIGANTAIDRARSGETRVGRGTKIDNLVQIGHNIQIGEHCIIVSQTGLSGSVTLGNYVVLAGQVGIADHVHLHDRAQVAAKSGISKDVPAGVVMRGIPAVPVTEFARRTVLERRLPHMVAELQELAKRVEQLESAKDD